MVGKGVGGEGEEVCSHFRRAIGLDLVLDSLQKQFGVAVDHVFGGCSRAFGEDGAHGVAALAMDVVMDGAEHCSMSILPKVTKDVTCRHLVCQSYELLVGTCHELPGWMRVNS